MSAFKKILLVLISLTLALGILPTGIAAEELSATYTLPTAEAENADEPLITVGAISDPHTDYNIQSKAPYVRKAYITALEKLKAEGIDLLLVGGDITSDNQDSGSNYRWARNVYDRTVLEYQKYSSEASKTGMTLWACGNHDHEVGRLKDGQFTNGDYNSYEGFVNMMLATCGYPLDLYVQEEESDPGMFPDHWLGAHYVIKGFDFIVINGLYNAWQEYSVGTVNWLDKTLSAIGEDKTVFIVGHYPLIDNRGLTNPSSYGIRDEAYDRFVNVMNKYDNAIYFYGHNHGTSGGMVPYISSDVFERITHYDASGAPVNSRDAKPTSFITAFMGSAGYYDGSLGANDPDIIQAMTITVYADRIEFKMINCGKNHGGKLEPAIWTVAREVKKSGDTVNDDPILVTEDLNKDVYYGSALGINKFKMPSGTMTLTAAGHSVEAEGLRGLNLSVKRIYSGTKYTAYMRKLSKVVNDAVIFEDTVLKASRTMKITTPVKITLPALINEFGDKTDGIQIAAYYWDAEGKLCMTDVSVNDDGTYSFIMTNLSAFALSARANVEDQLPEIKVAEKTDGDPNTTVIIISVTVGAAVIIALVVVIILVNKSKKKPNGKEADKVSQKEE